jgi:cytochrome P450
MIYGEELQKGLVFSEGEVWKKSRSIMSGLFHFDMLKERETIMSDVVAREIKDLSNQKVDLFKLGCTIGGDIVIESLLGK